MTDHLRSMGAVELAQADYRRLVDQACAHGQARASAWRGVALPSGPAIGRPERGAEAGQWAEGGAPAAGGRGRRRPRCRAFLAREVIVQSLTQTS
jgi:leucyl/phenylalanyl-tRNA---protein transferase